MAVAEPLSENTDDDNVGFWLATGDDEMGKYGVYFVGDYGNSRGRDGEQIVGVIPGNEPSDNRLGFKGTSGTGWVIRSNDLKFRIGLTIELNKSSGDEDKQFSLGIKNLGEDEIDIHVLSQHESTKIKKLDTLFLSLSVATPVRIGETAGRDRLLITLADPKT